MSKPEEMHTHILNLLPSMRVVPQDPIADPGGSVVIEHCHGDGWRSHVCILGVDGDAFTENLVLRQLERFDYTVHERRPTEAS